MTDKVEAFFTGCIVGIATAAVILMLTGSRVVVLKWEDGSAAICDGNRTLVVKDAETGEWREPTGWSLRACGD